MTDSNVILKELSNLAHKMFLNGESDVYIYGSRARGTATESSDWDILVITDDNLASSDNFKQFAFPFAEIGWKYGEQMQATYNSELNYWNLVDDKIYKAINIRLSQLIY